MMSTAAEKESKTRKALKDEAPIHVLLLFGLLCLTVAFSPNIPWLQIKVYREDIGVTTVVAQDLQGGICMNTFAGWVDEDQFKENLESQCVQGRSLGQDALTSADCVDKIDIVINHSARWLICQAIPEYTRPEMTLAMLALAWVMLFFASLGLLLRSVLPYPKRYRIHLLGICAVAWFFCFVGVVTYVTYKNSLQNHGGSSWNKKVMNFDVTIGFYMAVLAWASIGAGISLSPTYFFMPKLDPPPLHHKVEKDD